MCIANEPGARLRDIAASLVITERSAYSIVTDLAGAGYVIKQKDGRRNRYQIQAHLPLPEAASQEPAIGEVLAVLASRRREAAANLWGSNTRSGVACGLPSSLDDLRTRSLSARLRSGDGPA